MKERKGRFGGVFLNHSVVFKSSHWAVEPEPFQGEPSLQAKARPLLSLVLDGHQEAALRSQQTSAAGTASGLSLRGCRSVRPSLTFPGCQSLSVPTSQGERAVNRACAESVPYQAKSGWSIRHFYLRDEMAKARENTREIFSDQIKV